MEIVTPILNWLVGESFPSLLTAFAVLVGAFKVPKSIFDEKRATSLKQAMKLMFLNYMASEEGIVWRDYPKDRKKVVAGFVQKTGIDETVTREILDELHSEGKI